MNDPMTILKADHREAKRMLTTLADTDEGSERNRVAKELEAALSLHMEIEEQYLYPLVTTRVGVEDEEEAEVEHRLARDGLATMMSMVAQPGFGAAVEMLKGGITHHVEEEETELLPSLKEALPREEWLAVGDAIAKAKAHAGSPPPPATRKRSAKPKPASPKK
jgi:hemerythrin-like domain-containing protein